MKSPQPVLPNQQSQALLPDQPRQSHTWLDNSKALCYFWRVIKPVII